MTNFANQNILVVGASGGLGTEFATQFAENGATVISATSNDVNLENSASIQSFCDSLEASGVAIDGIVLAAGLVAFGTIADTPIAVNDRLMRVNFLGQAELVGALVPTLSNSTQNPFVLSISGVIAESPMAGLAAYSASKTALHGYATAAARELRRAGIRWIDARPGHTETGLASRAIYGTAPAFGAGLEPAKVVERIIAAIANDEKDLPSSSFKDTDA